MVRLLRDAPLDRVYTWGLDMSGLGGVGPASSRPADGIHGAGGIGGLLALDTTVSTECSGRWPAGPARSSRQGLAAQDSRSGSAKYYWFLYDANGNVGQVLDATNLSAITTAAKYEYDPYGNTVSATGTYAAANPFRFSTKWFDTETGLSYYGYRYYSERLGRWMRRDPIGEGGGLNLVAFVRNSALTRADRLGLNVYAIDGTWSKYGDGTNTEMFFRQSSEGGSYWDGVGTNLGRVKRVISAMTGWGAGTLFDRVKERICTDFCASENKDNFKINLVGWSRGANIALSVAQALNDEGCTCCYKTLVRSWWSGRNKSVDAYRTYRPVSVNWMGLFDAVDMTVTPGWTDNAAPNVKHLNHALKTEHQLLYPTVNTGTAGWCHFWRHDGSPTTHNDIGTNRSNNDAYSWMVQKAIAAGVAISPTLAGPTIGQAPVPGR